MRAQRQIPTFRQGDRSREGGRYYFHYTPHRPGGVEEAVLWVSVHYAVDKEDWRMTFWLDGTEIAIYEKHEDYASELSMAQEHSDAAELEQWQDQHASLNSFCLCTGWDLRWMLEDAKQRWAAIKLLVIPCVSGY